MIKLENRGIIEIKGQETPAFLNNILTRNIDAADYENAVFAALLSPQGKFLFDMFIIKNGENSFLIDCNDVNELFTKLRMYKLRAQIEINNLSNDLHVYHSLEKPIDSNFIYFKDPRNNELGYRVFANNVDETGDFADYETLRIKNSIPDTSNDLIRDGDFALEGLLDELGAIDFHKGCYIGQEMTSRMKRRGTLKQKLCSVQFNGPKPPYNTPIMANETEIGKIRTGVENHAMALIRFDRLKNAIANGENLFALETKLIIDKPD